jgi:hypothetical protein
MKPDYHMVVRRVVYANGGIREAVEDPALKSLVDSPAVDRCLTYLLKRNHRYGRQIDLELERYRATMLLIILAAMQLGTPESVLEALRLLAARNVDTRGLPRSQRFKKAGEARTRPIVGERYYVRAGYAARMQRRLTQEIYDLVTDLSRLENVLAERGEEAISKYL